MERKLLTVLEYLAMGNLRSQVKGILRHSPTVGETRSQPQELLKNYIAPIFI
ncbi:MAG: hypothetical protein RMY16_10150 [Nostoc sp. DedQUE12b]|uniref:hypothetical protein n=1 Tax=Nostoc sp. DedQUE12b TaxID=3075398 RepID=UPI002AD356AB|nr:hypothetical protein [Nostoc sp. DedQUE12b]MDZ8085911.1 hypothetical protein [Nostoc sp. DedQUE12b]